MAGRRILRRMGGQHQKRAPVENLEYEEVNYWEELQTIMEWGKSHVTSTLHICWGAQAGLYYHYGIPKYKREKKLSGIYRHKVLDRKVPLVRSMDDYIMAPIPATRRFAEKILRRCLIL